LPKLTLTTPLSLLLKQPHYLLKLNQTRHSLTLNQLATRVEWIAQPAQPSHRGTSATKALFWRERFIWRRQRTPPLSNLFHHSS
jgi:hypothetical protein